MGQSYRDLIAWQKAMQLAKRVNRISNKFPKEETYGLRSQVRRCAVSVPSNIAEGQGRLSNREFRPFLSHALGSLMELEAQSILSGGLGYWSIEEVQQVLRDSGEVAKIVYGLISSIEKRESKGRKASPLAARPAGH